MLVYTINKLCGNECIQINTKPQVRNLSTEILQTLFICFFSRIDMTITPIEESYALLNRYGLHYPSSDAERVDGLTYAWQKLRGQAGSVAATLLEIQPVFKNDLLEGVTSFKTQLQEFVGDYREKYVLVYIFSFEQFYSRS